MREIAGGKKEVLGFEFECMCVRQADLSLLGCKTIYSPAVRRVHCSESSVAGDNCRSLSHFFTYQVAINNLYV